MPKRNSGSGFNKNKHVATPKNLNFQALGSLDNYVHVLLQTLPTKHDLGQMNNLCFNCGALLCGKKKIILERTDILQYSQHIVQKEKLYYQQPVTNF